MFIPKFRSDKVYVLTMLTRSFEREGEDLRNMPSSTAGDCLARIAALSVPDLLVIPGSPLRSQTNLQKFLKDSESIERDPLTVRILHEANAFRLTVQNLEKAHKENVVKRGLESGVSADSAYEVHQVM